jgi:uncharacterized membrane protein
MTASRLEAFSDGVLAIIITIMVLELKVPHGDSLAALRPILPTFLTYILSFTYIGIYWNNHHHLLKATKRVTGRVMWSNLHLLFWLSLVPFATGWLGENHSATTPTMLYGAILLMAAISYTLLQTSIVCQHGKESKLAESLGTDLKGKISIACYLAGIMVAPFEQWISDALYTAVALLWFIPDKRLNKVVEEIEG